MRTNKILLLLSAILFLSSCSNDEDSYNYLDTKKVTEVTDFVDKRDGKTYKCVKIGNQIWMAENLSYYLPKGQIDGCYTWNEADINMEKLESQLGKKVELTQASYFELYDELFWEGYWRDYWPGEGETLKEYYYELETWMYYYEWTTIEEADEYLQANCPNFYADMQKRIAAMQKSDEEIVRDAAAEHTSKAEASNGNYSEEYGFLYTLDGALAAVPEGWRLPSDADWKELEAALGMSRDLDAMNEWRGENAGDYLKVGGEAKFNALYTGCNAWMYNKNEYGYYVNRDYSAYFWASDVKNITETEEEEDEEGNVIENTYVVREGIVRQVSIYSSKIWRGTTRTDKVCYSVRCVIDAEDFETLFGNSNTEAGY